MPALIDLTGKRFERLTVIERGPNVLYGTCSKPAWHCECDCKKRTVVAGDSLRDGSTRSCGCLRTEEICRTGRREYGSVSWLADMTGQTFGSWVVVERGPNSSNRQARWLCECICGTRRLVLGPSLRRGLSLSCGGCTTRRVERGPLGERTGVEALALAISEIESSFDDECIFWRGPVCSGGYGTVGDDRAHTVIFERFHFPLVGLTVDHLCRIRRCVNPRHFEGVPGGENSSRAGWARGWSARNGGIALEGQQSLSCFRPGGEYHLWKEAA